MRLICGSCRCEVERVDISRGRVVAVCPACDAYGDAAELVAGVKLGPAQPMLPAGWRATVETAKRYNAPAPAPKAVTRRAASGTR